MSLVMRIPVGYGPPPRPQPARRSSCRRRSQRIRNVPGVIDASTTIGLPVFGGFGSDFDVVGGRARGSMARGDVAICSDGYFRTLKIPLLRGRDFTADDMNTARKSPS